MLVFKSLVAVTRVRRYLPRAVDGQATAAPKAVPGLQALLHYLSACSLDIKSGYVFCRRNGTPSIIWIGIALELDIKGREGRCLAEAYRHLGLKIFGGGVKTERTSLNVQVCE